MCKQLFSTQCGNWIEGRLNKHSKPFAHVQDHCARYSGKFIDSFIWHNRILNKNLNNSSPGCSPSHTVSFIAIDAKGSRLTLSRQQISIPDLPVAIKFKSFVFTFPSSPPRIPFRFSFHPSTVDSIPFIDVISIKTLCLCGVYRSVSPTDRYLQRVFGKTSLNVIGISWLSATLLLRWENSRIFEGIATGWYFGVLRNKQASWLSSIKRGDWTVISI